MFVFLYIGLAIIILILAIVFILLIFGAIHIAVDAKFAWGQPDFTLIIYLWKIRLTKISLSDIKMDAFPLRLFYKGKVDTSIKGGEKKQTLDKEEITDIIKKGQTILSEIKEEGNLSKEILTILRFHNIKWSTTVGLYEAPPTAIAVGTIWALKSNVLEQLNRLLEGIEKPLIDVRPAYHQFNFQTHIRCMITFKLGKAIHAAYRTSKNIKRRQVDKCQNIQYKV